MKEVLFKLDEFCSQNQIEFMVTGTCALALLGVPSSYRPSDIDVKVFHLTEKQAQKLLELEFLSGLKKNSYSDGKCFTFLIDGTKINVIVDTEPDYDIITSQCVVLNFIDENRCVHRAISVQNVSLALAAKMKLYRDKDKAFMLDLIHNLTSLH